MVPGKLNNWAFDTVPQAGLNGRIGYQPRGKGLGGSSAINAMVYIRGHRSDYDQWAALGNTGWSFADVCPISSARKTMPISNGEYHGKGGPLPVNKLRTDNPVQQTFLQAAREAQFRIREDFNGEDHEGLGIYQVTQRTANAGARHGPMSIRTWPRAPICGSKPMRKRAYPVRRQARGRRRIPQGDETKQIRARREIIVASGAFQTPHLLMLSGVGDGAALAKHGIASVHHLPGVGHNLQDHPDFIFAYLSDSPHFTGMSFSGLAHQLRAIMQYRRERRGAMTSNFAECGGFPEDPPRSRCARHPAAFRHGDGRRPRPQATLGPRLLLPCLPAAAEEPRQRRAWQRRSVCGPADRSEFFGEADDLEIDDRGLQDHAAADGDAGAARPTEKGNVHRGHRQPMTTSALCCAPASIPSITRRHRPEWAPMQWPWSIRKLKVHGLEVCASSMPPDATLIGGNTMHRPS